METALQACIFTSTLLWPRGRGRILSHTPSGLGPSGNKAPFSQVKSPCEEQLCEVPLTVNVGVLTHCTLPPLPALLTASLCQRNRACGSAASAQQSHSLLVGAWPLLGHHRPHPRLFWQCKVLCVEDPRKPHAASSLLPVGEFLSQV